MLLKKVLAAGLSLALMTGVTACSSNKPETTENSDQRVDVSGLTITLEKTTYTYDGKAKTPKVTVTSEDKESLKEGTDYSVTYKNNVNVGTATVTIKGKKDYKGSVVKSFSIVKSSKSVDAKAMANVLDEIISFEEGDSGTSAKITKTAADLLVYVTNVQLSKANVKSVKSATDAWYKNLTTDQKDIYNNNLDTVEDTVDGMLSSFKSYSSQLDDAGVLDIATQAVKVKTAKKDWKVLKDLLDSYE
jgi:hypothetical protein